MRILVTGITGYVGGRAARRLVEEGHRVRALARSPAAADAAASLGAEPVAGALHDAAGLARAASGCDAVLHAAASDDPAFAEANRRAVDAMIDALPPGAGFVAHGGSVVFGPTGEAVFDGSEPFAPPPPLAGKAAADRAILERGAARGLRAAVVYGSFVYGRGRGAVLPTAMVGAALRTGRSGVPGDGRQAWATVHVDDWADLIARAVVSAPAGGTAYPAAGRIRTMDGIAAAVAAATGTPVEAVPAERAAERWGFLGPALATDQRFSARRAEVDLGWRPILDGFEEELLELAADLRTGGR
jgi:nucleoside-diphosphate-sugar epimerase